jgi:beta-glucosidase
MMWIPVTVLLLSAMVWATDTKPAASGSKTHSAVTAISRSDAWWSERHEAVRKRLKEGPVDLLMIGDSITHNWEDAGKEIWAKYYAPRHAVNLGFSGDCTQHVLWRLDHGEVDGISPKLAVLMIGTNNSNGDENTAEEVADGILAIVKKLNDKLPDTKVLVLGIFPVAEKTCPQRERSRKANALVEKYIAEKAAKGNKNLQYLDLESKFLQPDGTLPKAIMPDFLHPNAKGYQIWAEAMEPKIVELMGEKK